MIKGGVDLVGSARLISKLEQVAQGADDLSDAWPDVGEVFAARQKEIFDKGGRPKWKPLSPDYILQRRREGLGGKTLVRTGLLRYAVTDSRPARSAGAYAVFGPAGRTAPHWTLHKYGTKKMPRRNPLPAFNKAERKQVRDLLAKHILEPLEG